MRLRPGLWACAAAVLAITWVSSARGQSADAAAEAPEASEVPEVLRPGYDFEQHDRAFLVTLSRQLASRLRVFEARWRQAIAAGGEVTGELDPEQRELVLAREVRQLARENDRLTTENDALRRLLRRMSERPTESPTSAETDADIAEAAEGSPDPPVSDASPPARYAYRYELFRVRDERDDLAVRVVQRSDGQLVLVERDNDLRDDVIGLRVFFRNDEAAAGRFSMALLVGRIDRGRGLTSDRPRVLGRATHTTPMLEPGELHQFDVEVNVDRAREVRVADVGRVRFFPAGR